MGVILVNPQLPSEVVTMLLPSHRRGNREEESISYMPEVMQLANIVCSFTVCWVLTTTA